MSTCCTPPPSLKLLHEQGPKVHARAKGVYLWDNQGNQYLEGLAGLWCTALGYGEEELAKVAEAQLRTLSYSQLFAGKTHEPSIELAEKPQRHDALRRGPRVLWPVRQRRQRHPDQADVVLPQRHRQAGKEKDHLPHRRLPRRHHRLRVAHRPAALPQALRPAHQGGAAHRPAPLLPGRPGGGDGGAVLRPHRRQPRGPDPPRRAGDHRRLYRRAHPGRRRGHGAAGRLLREGAGSARPARHLLH